MVVVVYERLLGGIGSVDFGWFFGVICFESLGFGFLYFLGVVEFGKGLFFIIEEEVFGFLGEF